MLLWMAAGLAAASGSRTLAIAIVAVILLNAALAYAQELQSLRQVGFLSNRHLLRGVVFAIVFAGAIIYAPPLQSIFHTAPLPITDLLVLACFPVIVWGSDELWRARQRRRERA